MPTVTVAYDAATRALTVNPDPVRVTEKHDTITWRPKKGGPAFSFHQLTIAGAPHGEFGDPVYGPGQIDVAVTNTAVKGVSTLYKYTIAIMDGSGIVVLDPEIKNVGPPPGPDRGHGHGHGSAAE
jgi:hypothetical protein